MAASQTILYPTGLFIPVEKQALFMVAFEDMLVTVHNVVPMFGPTTTENSCEIKFKYLGNKSYKPGSVCSDLDKAVEFLRVNMSILGPKKSPRRRRMANSFMESPQIINLEDENDTGTVDLTDVGNQVDPEVIVLEDSVIYTDKDSQRINTSCGVVDLTNVNEPSKTTRRNNLLEDDVQILNVTRFKPQASSLGSTSDCEIKILDHLSVKNRKCNKKKNKRNIIRSITSAKSNFSLNPGSFISLSSTDSLPRKKRKLQDISNIQSTASCSTSPSSVHLSENVIKYYENISKVVNKPEKEKNKRLSSKCFSVASPLKDNAKKKNKSPTRKYSPLIICQERNKKRKIFTPQNRLSRKNIWNHRRKLLERSINGQNSPRTLKYPLGGRLKRILQQRISNSVRNIGETNTFNPNPYEVELVGLRPIVIDGCNVAIGHGRGKFSPKGLKICVDYFATRGHTKIKIFLPQFREEEFPADLLEALKTKCDVVFTPSQCINGKRRTPYDDRFIVQYATEFGGVIVSTDNYRDILKENSRWQETIEKRLLMFTWVDDFLMFPVDPLGRSGPTLEEFLKF